MSYTRITQFSFPSFRSNKNSQLGEILLSCLSTFRLPLKHLDLQTSKLTHFYLPSFLQINNSALLYLSVRFNRIFTLEMEELITLSRLLFKLSNFTPNFSSTLSLALVKLFKSFCYLVRGLFFLLERLRFDHFNFLFSCSQLLSPLMPLRTIQKTLFLHSIREILPMYLNLFLLTLFQLLYHQMELKSFQGHF